MKKLITSFLIFLSVTFPAYAEEVIDVFEEYASFNDEAVRTFYMSLNSHKNETVTATFLTECDNDFRIFITKMPQNGEMTIKDKQFTYIPDNNFTGSDSFCYRIYSNGIYSNISRCNINITDENIEKIQTTDFYYEDTKNPIFKRLAEKNIIKGEKIAGKYYFYPNSVITRATAANYISAALNSENRDNKIKPVFSSPDKLNSMPNEKLTRAEMLTMLEKAALLKSQSDITLLYPDSKAIPDYAKQSVKNLVANGFLENSENTFLRPLDNVTKAEFAELLSKLVELNEEDNRKTLAMRIKESFYAKIIA